MSLNNISNTPLKAMLIRGLASTKLNTVISYPDKPRVECPRLEPLWDALGGSGVSKFSGIKFFTMVRFLKIGFKDFK